MTRPSFLLPSAGAILLISLGVLPASGQAPFIERASNPERLHDEYGRRQQERHEEYHFEISSRELAAIDQLAVKLESSSHEIVKEIQEHLSGQRHTEKLATDADQLHKLAERLHEELHRSRGRYSDFRRLRSDATHFIEIVARLPRTIDLIGQQPLDRSASRGLRHLMEAYREAHVAAMAIDGYLPVDTKVVDRQAQILLEAVKEAHTEFHEHLERYELSHQIDLKLQSLERLAKHVRKIAHNLEDRDWVQEELEHLTRDAADLREAAREAERLIVRQARQGIATEDFIGVEHLQDAMTDIHAAAYLLEHMIRKWQTTHAVEHRVTYPPANGDRNAAPKRDSRGRGF